MIGRSAVVDDVDFAVVIEKERGVDPVDLREHNGFAPRSDRIPGRDVKTSAAAQIRRNYVKKAFVIADSCREDALRTLEVIQLGLRRAIEHVPDLLPVDQITAMKDGNGGEEGECRIDEVIVI